MSRGLWIASLALVACAPTLQDGRFACHADTDCPSGFVCRADSLCYRGTGSDGGAIGDGGSTLDGGPADGALDAEIHDAGPDAFAQDAPSGCGTNCIQVIVLNADPTLMGGNVQWMDMHGTLQHVGIPAYGRTSATTDIHDVPVGSHWTVFAEGSLTSTIDLQIPTSTRYLLALAPSSSGASMQLFPQPVAGLHTDDYVYIHLLDMTDDLTGLVVSGSGRNAGAQAVQTPFSHGTPAMGLQFLPAQRGAMTIALGGSASPPLLAALLDEQISSSEGTYYVVVAGSTRRHLADAAGFGNTGGLRFIPGLPSSTALQSAPLVRVLDTLSSVASVCDGPTRLAMLGAGAMSAPLIPPHVAPWPLSIHLGSDCSTGSSHDVTVPTTVGRTLVSLAGDPLATWSAVAITEPVPTGSDAQSVVIQNGLSVTADIATATAITSLATSSASFATVPAMVTATTTGGTKTFTWSPVARQSWLVVGNPGGALQKAFEVDSPYDAAWTLSIQPGT